jgi:hypothetical protein
VVADHRADSHHRGELQTGLAEADARVECDVAVHGVVDRAADPPERSAEPGLTLYHQRPAIPRTARPPGDVRGGLHPAWRRAGDDRREDGRRRGCARGRGGGRHAHRRGGGRRRGDRDEDPPRGSRRRRGRCGRGGCGWSGDRLRASDARGRSERGEHEDEGRPRRCREQPGGALARHAPSSPCPPSIPPRRSHVRSCITRTNSLSVRAKRD